MEIIQDELRDRLGEGLSFNQILAPHSTIGVGGSADYYFVAKSITDIVDSVNISRNFNIPFVVIGMGSNVIFSDLGFRGMVIENRSENIVVNAERGEVISDSGIHLSKLLNLVAAKNMGGIEFLAGVPGTLGGAIYGNAGSATSYIGDFVKSVTMLDMIRDELRVVKRTQAWMEFTYRSSKLKRLPKNSFKPVILTASLRLPQKRNDEILKLIHENLKIKQNKQPYGEKSAGSFFKNLGKSPEQSAGYLLEKSGAKKLKVGGASFSKKHANFIINKGTASATDIKKLAEMARMAVVENFDLNLQEEVEYLGEWEK